jgi:hypothetical protein
MYFQRDYNIQAMRIKIYNSIINNFELIQESLMHILQPQFDNYYNQFVNYLSYKYFI